MSETCMEIRMGLSGNANRGKASRPSEGVARRSTPAVPAENGKEAGRGQAYAFLAGVILILVAETLGIAHGLSAIFGR